MQLKLDRAAQAFEIMAAIDDALASGELRLAEGAAGACDPRRNVLEMPGMGEDGDVAMSKLDQVTRRGVAAGFAIGAHGVESGGFGAAVEQHRRRQSGPIRAALERGHGIIARRDDNETIDPARDQGLDAPPLNRCILVRGDEQKIVAVTLCERLDAVR